RAAALAPAPARRPPERREEPRSTGGRPSAACAPVSSGRTPGSPEGVGTGEAGWGTRKAGAPRQARGGGPGGPGGEGRPGRLVAQGLSAPLTTKKRARPISHRNVSAMTVRFFTASTIAVARAR